tara:strand:+ start:4393 stop:5133 length:741 start_codon:yes stop_codon:yes gene_type:complete
MSRWRLEEKTWCNWPSQPIGLIEIIGGSYFSASPQISYKYLLENLEKKGFAIHAWSYIPSFDHQFQANEAWKNFRNCRKKLKSRISDNLKVIRLGHSLGSKLHLLSPDNGYNSNAFISLGFNNFNATKSIPMLGKITSKLKFDTEFSPSPKETMHLISNNYLQANNLVINFSNDKIDQSLSLVKCLRMRDIDKTITMQINGNHLTPVSTGLTQSIMEDFEMSLPKPKNLEALLKIIASYSLDKLSP